MTDYFALLGVKRGPKVDGDLLKTNFHRLCHALHPDHMGTAAGGVPETAAATFAEINAAYRCLQDPKDRLAHLIEIELGHKPQSIQHIPDEIASVGTQVMTVCRGVDTFLGVRQKDPPPMVRAQQFQDSMAWLSKCDALEAALHPLRLQLDQELDRLGAAWNEPAGHTPGHSTENEATALDRCYRLASYLAKWTSQIKERQLTLSL